MAPRSVATGRSAFTTVFQVLPRLATVVRHMRPTWHLRSLAAVTPEFLAAQGISGCIWDVDGTLTGDRRPAIAAEARAPFERLLRMPGARHAILSNASEERYRQLGTMFPVLPILRGYEKHGETAMLFRRLQGTNDTWSNEELNVRLSGGWTVVRKPRAALVECALRELQLEKDKVVMIGDQYMTDVAGANFAGIRSIKLPTMDGASFRRVVRLGQYIETGLYRLFYGTPRSAA